MNIALCLRLNILLAPLALTASGLFASGSPITAPADTIIISKGLVLQVPRGNADIIVNRNPVESDLILGKWKSPREGDQVVFPGNAAMRWRQVSADNQGWFTDSALQGCYVSATVHRDRQETLILECFGNEITYINGTPRTGNPYGLKDTYESWEPRFDYSRLPVSLRAGDNDLLFRCVRGVLKVRLCRLQKPVFLNAKDVTLPDCIEGIRLQSHGAIVVVNGSDRIVKDLSIETTARGDSMNRRSVPVIQPYSVRKIAIDLVCSPRSAGETVPVLVSLRNRNGLVDSTTIFLRCLGATANHKETFISSIDGSVQYYGILPAGGTGNRAPALVLSLHGASVEAINQSGSYEPKDWCMIVAPTNRRPYGFNWEEWGRMDALEVLNLVKTKYSVDSTRIYLTGHSMGGHGTWHIGSLYPDQFAAIGPSAGWISFWTYRFRGINLGDTSAIRAMIRRATTPSETFRHAANYDQLGVYILHGSEDDNVPASEARSMVEQLKTEHHDFIYHEQPGVGHWWDLSDEPGADCVDWAPMFDFFARHARPLRDQMRGIRFRTSNPGVSSRDGWITIDAQERQLEMSTVDFHFDPALRRFTGTTANVQRLTIDAGMLKRGDTVTIVVDSETVRLFPQDRTGPNTLQLVKVTNRWAVGREPFTDVKGPGRYGTFKDAFRNSMILVYGTKGSKEETRWAFEKARFDAEKLWYQGNGSVDVVADTDPGLLSGLDRNIVLYGNRETNAAWKSLLSESPVQVGEGWVRIGKKTITGDDLSCLFVRPRRGSETAIVGAVSGSGPVGMKISNRLPYLNPGIGLPDCTLMSSELLTEGDAGVLGAGFFGNDWSVDSGEFVWSRK